jgi:polar amino acid transport system substrate-binding protein
MPMICLQPRFLFLGLSLVSLFLPSCGQPAASAGKSTLRVGMDLTYPPFEMLDPSGRPDGAGVRMAEELATHLGRPLRVVPMEFSGLIPALQTGNVDLVLSSMTATDERRKSIDFSEPYAFTGLALLVAKNSNIQSIDDLKTRGRVIAAKTATTAETWAIKHLPQAKRVVFEDQSACVLEVVQGRADAFLYDQLSIYNYAKENPETTRGLLKPFVEESWAIAIAKGNNSLRDEVNGFIAAFRARNGFAELGERYLQEEKRFLEAEGIPFILR